MMVKEVSLEADDRCGGAGAEPTPAGRWAESVGHVGDTIHAA